MKKPPHLGIGRRARDCSCSLVASRHSIVTTTWSGPAIHSQYDPCGHTRPWAWAPSTRLRAPPFFSSSALPVPAKKTELLSKRLSNVKAEIANPQTKFYLFIVAPHDIRVASCSVKIPSQVNYLSCTLNLITLTAIAFDRYARSARPHPAGWIAIWTRHDTVIQIVMAVNGCGASAFRRPPTTIQGPTLSLVWSLLERSELVGSDDYPHVP